MTYAGRLGAVIASIDGESNDGSSIDGPIGARDTIGIDVENVTGGSAADRLTGSGKANTLDGGPGADRVDGLGGSDTATYASRTRDVSVDLDGVADDGNADDGSGDALTRIENVTGGSGNDTLTGNSQANQLTGNTGSDSISGLGGDDTIFAKDGAADDISCGGNATAGDKLSRDPGIDAFTTAGPDACESVS